MHKFCVSFDYIPQAVGHTSFIAPIKQTKFYIPVSVESYNVIFLFNFVQVLTSDILYLNSLLI